MKNKTDRKNGLSAQEKAKSEKIRKYCENTATLGILLVAVAMAAPFTDLTDTYMLHNFKWLYAAGALIFAIARLAGVKDPADSPNIRRLRRMEFWAGLAFVIGGCFWFYNETRFADIPTAGSLSILRETILFSLAGALIQVIASWLIYARDKKESRRQADEERK